MFGAIRRRVQPVPVSKAVDRFLHVSLLGMIASGSLAVAFSGALDVPTMALTGTAIVVRALMVAGKLQARLPEHLAAVLAVGYLCFYPIDYYLLTRDFLAATVHLVCFLAAVLVVKASTSRDYFLVKLIALLEILAASVLATNVAFLLCLGVFVLCGVAAQSSGEIEANLKVQRAVAREGIQGAHRRLAGVTLFLFLGILVVAAALFFVLPRTAHAALEHLVPERYHLPGFSNEVLLGQIGEIRMRSTPVMHIQIERQRRPLALKWKGATLAKFDGRRWFNEIDGGTSLASEEGGWVKLTSDDQRRRPGTRINYEVQLKSLTSDVLFFAGTPETVTVESAQLIRTSAGGYRLGMRTLSGTRYFATSFLEPTVPVRNSFAEELTGARRAVYLGTPAGLDPRIRELAREVAGGAGSELDRAREIEHHLRTSYGYTTELLQEAVPNALGHFLFVRKKGHCEYFASAMAVMLRTAGIPSRVATGFQSGVFNPMSGWYLVRASDAHSWVEAWLDGYGWVTFDPTPPDPSAGNSSIWTRATLLLDAVDVFWQEWVMSYDLERQVLLAGRVGQSGRSFSTDWVDWLRSWKVSWKNAGSVDRRMVFALIAVVALAAFALRAGPRVWRWWRTQQRVRQLLTEPGTASDATVLYERMLAVLKKRGVEKPYWLTPVEFAAMVPGGESRRIVGELTRQYNTMRFGGRGEAAPRIVVLLEQLEHNGGQ